jgi:hypothetical protein
MSEPSRLLHTRIFTGCPTLLDHHHHHHHCRQTLDHQPWDASHHPLVALSVLILAEIGPALRSMASRPYREMAGHLDHEAARARPQSPGAQSRALDADAGMVARNRVVLQVRVGGHHAMDVAGVPRLVVHSVLAACQLCCYLLCSALLFGTSCYPNFPCLNSVLSVG